MTSTPDSAHSGARPFSSALFPAGSGGSTLAGMVLRRSTTTRCSFAPAPMCDVIENNRVFDIGAGFDSHVAADD